MGSVLIIEDDADIRGALSEILTDEGHEVVTAGNGQEGLALLRRGARPALILLDLMMPVMNGWQFMAALRAEPALAGIPVVVISADASVADKIADLHVAGLLRKPIQLSDLIAVVHKFTKP